jgi:replication factor A2
LAPQTCRPLTLKQLAEATMEHPDSAPAVDGKDVSQVAFVACIRGLKEQANGADYLFEDGTGTMPGHVWSDKLASTVSAGFQPKEGAWVRVFGTLKQMQGTRYVQVNRMRAMADPNELTLHMLQALSHHLGLTRGTPTKGSAAQSSLSAPAADPLAGLGDMAKMLSPIQLAVLTTYQRGSTDEIGLHINVAVQALRPKYAERDVKDTVAWLTNEGYLYQTIDDMHAKSAA